MGCPVYSRVFSSICGLYPLDTSVTLFPSVATTLVSRHSQLSPGRQNFLLLRSILCEDLKVGVIDLKQGRDTAVPPLDSPPLLSLSLVETGTSRWRTGLRVCGAHHCHAFCHVPIVVLSSSAVWPAQQEWVCERLLQGGAGLASGPGIEQSVVTLYRVQEPDLPLKMYSY